MSEELKGISNLVVDRIVEDLQDIVNLNYEWEKCNNAVREDIVNGWVKIVEDTLKDKYNSRQGGKAMNKEERIEEIVRENSKLTVYCFPFASKNHCRQNDCEGCRIKFLAKAISKQVVLKSEVDEK